MKSSPHLKLTVTLGIIVVAIEVGVLFTLGAYYLGRFGAEVDRRLVETASRPGALVSTGALTTEAFAQRDTLESIVGPALDDAMIVTFDGTVLVSLAPENLGRRWSEIPEVNPAWLQRVSTNGITERITTDSGSYLVSLAPIALVGGETPVFFDYVRIRRNR